MRAAARARVHASRMRRELDDAPFYSYKELALLIGARRGTPRRLQHELALLFANSWGEFSVARLEEAKALAAARDHL